MKQQILPIALALCLCTSSIPVAHAWQEVPSPQEDVLTEEFTSELVTCDSTIPDPQEIYEAMIALKDQDAYKEGTTWTDYEPYSDAKGYYYWKGGTLGGTNIVAVGCVAFAFTLSDAAFGSLPARMYEAGNFDFKDIKVGDILRVNNDTHTVIVLEVSDMGVIVAEGNLSGKVHWGRAMSKDEVMRDTSHYITRYPEGYVLPNDPTANETIASGTLTTGLTWNLTKAGTLTISGSGAMPDYSGPSEQPWYDNSSQIRKIIIEDGVTGIGSSAFYGNAALSVEISNSVTTIGNNAFYECSLIYASIPSSVKTISDDAFRLCPNLTSVTVSEGVETIGQRAFRGCVKLASVDLPASIKEMGAGAFYDCTALLRVTFASGSNQVKMGEDLFARCWYLYDVTLPQNIDCISDRMFQDCYVALYSVCIPQGATKIGDSAFSSCSVLNALTIPESITDIETGAFSACNSLTDIYFTGTEAQWGSIWKASNVITALANVTIHYEYRPDTDDGDDNDNSSPNPTTAPTTEPDPTTAPTTEPDPTTAPTTEPNPTTAPTTEPDPTTAPTTEPNPTTAPTTEPDPTTEPETEPDPTTEPETEPDPTTEPETEPDPTTEPETEPDPTAKPATKPDPTAKPATKPDPTAKPATKPDPTAKPATKPDPTTAPSTAPEAEIPFIEGESGKDGWEAIKEGAANALEGKWINVNMNGASIVPGNVLDSVKGQNVTISFDMGDGISWLVNGSNVTADHANDVDLSVQVGTSAIPEDIVNDVAGDCQTKQISLAHSGDFGYSAVLMINMDSANAELYANLFYYNESAGGLEFVTAAQINEDGIAELIFTHASNYVIVLSDDVMDESSNEDSSGSDDESVPANDSSSQETGEQSSKTGESDIVIGGSDAVELQHEGNGMKLMWLILIVVAVVAAIGAITFLAYKKVDKEENKQD